MRNWLLRALKGALIGAGAILPGISGGVLCVVLGIYRQMMAFLAHPFHAFKENAAFFLPILVGFVLGVLGLSKAVSWLFRQQETPAVCLFIGLVVGTFPSLFREAGSQGRPKSAWISLLAGAAVMGVIMYFLSGSGQKVTPNVWWWLLCGFLWGIGLIVPGMSPSSLFIFFGLYEPMTAAIGALDFAVLLPMGAGLLLTVLVLARGVNAIFERKYPQAMHAILGIVIASTLGILPIGATAAGWDIPIWLLCFAFGVAVSVGMSRLGDGKPAVE